MKYTVRSKNRHSIEIPRKVDLSSEVVLPVGKENVPVRILEVNTDGSLRTVMIRNKIYQVQIEKRSDGFPGKVILRGVSYSVDVEKIESTRYRPPQTARQISGKVCADLPGQVTALLIESGSHVKKDQPILILEAMKMENEVLAPKDGVFTFVGAIGKPVMKGDLIAEIA